VESVTVHWTFFSGFRLITHHKEYTMCQPCDSDSGLSSEAQRKRHFLKAISATGIGLGLAGMTLPGVAADSPPPPKPENVISAEAALARLVAGNQRYINGQSTVFDFQRDRAALAGGQNPYASIVSCADARVVPELCFDEQRGDLFVTRVAGNYVTPDILSSLEFAALVLGVPLIMVLGHQHCGAVVASVAAVENHEQFPGHIQTVTTALAPAVRATKKDTGDRIDNVIRKNVILNVERLKQAAPVISKLVAEKKVKIVGGVYNLETGKVELVA